MASNLICEPLDEPSAIFGAENEDGAMNMAPLEMFTVTSEVEL